MILKKVFKRASAILFVAICFQLVGCNVSISSEINDLIEPIALVSGLSDTIPVGDIFYTEKYNLQFEDHKNINIRYLKETGLLILHADTSLEGLSIIPFKFSVILFK